MVRLLLAMTLLLMGSLLAEISPSVSKTEVPGPQTRPVRGSRHALDELELAEVWGEIG